MLTAKYRYGEEPAREYGVTSGTSTQQQQQQQPQTQAKYPAGGYTGLAGVSDNTAQQAGKATQGYQPSQQVTNAQNMLSQVQGQQPQGYSSKYGAQLDSILQQITNPEKFQYSFDQDNLFQSYRDMYTQQGKQASLDAQGQAAGLTGGYGNSYGQNVGTQAYQQYLGQLMDKGLDMYDRAYQRWQGDLANKKDAYGYLSSADQTEYGRYRDDVGDWQNLRDYYTNRYDAERNFDFSQYQDNRDFWIGLAQVENQDYRSDQDRQEAIRQYEKNFAEQQRQYDQNFSYQKMSDEQKYAYNYVTAILANGQMPSEELLAAAGLTMEDAQKMMAQATGGGAGGGGGKTFQQVVDEAAQYGVKDLTGNLTDYWTQASQKQQEQKKKAEESKAQSQQQQQAAAAKKKKDEAQKLITSGVSQLTGLLGNAFTKKK